MRARAAGRDPWRRRAGRTGGARRCALRATPSTKTRCPRRWHRGGAYRSSTPGRCRGRCRRWRCRLAPVQAPRAGRAEPARGCGARGIEPLDDAATSSTRAHGEAPPTTQRPSLSPREDDRRVVAHGRERTDRRLGSTTSMTSSARDLHGAIVPGSAKEGPRRRERVRVVRHRAAREGPDGVGIEIGADAVRTAASKGARDLASMWVCAQPRSGKKSSGERTRWNWTAAVESPRRAASVIARASLAQRKPTFGPASSGRSPVARGGAALRRRGEPAATAQDVRRARARRRPGAERLDVPVRRPLLDVAAQILDPEDARARRVRPDAGRRPAQLRPD